MLDTISEDLDFFSFGEVNLTSDEEEEEDLELKETNRINELKKLCDKYLPEGGEIRHFHLKPNESLHSRLTMRLGLSDLLQSLEYYYGYGDYTRTYQLGLEILNYKDLCKPSLLKDVYETLIRACLKLNEFKNAGDLVDDWEGANDPGHFMLKAKVLGLNYRLQESLDLYQKYNQMRPNDYLLWKQLGLTFIHNFNSKKDTNEVYDQDRGNEPNLITLILKQSYKLMIQSYWDLSIDFNNIRFKNELSKLINTIQSTLNFNLSKINRDNLILNDNHFNLKQNSLDWIFKNCIGTLQLECKLIDKFDKNKSHIVNQETGEIVNRSERSVKAL